MPSWLSWLRDDTGRGPGLRRDGPGGWARGCRRRSPGRRLPTLASTGAILGLFVYALAVYAAVARPGLGGGGDRAPGIVLARYRQALLDAAADDRPLPGPSMAALLPASVPPVLVPELAGSLDGGDGSDLTSRPAAPGRSRSPPVV